MGCCILLPGSPSLRSLPLLVSVHMQVRIPAVPLCRMSEEALSDRVFVHELTGVLDGYFNDNWGSASSRAMDWDAMKVVLRGECMKITYGVKQQFLSDLDRLEKRLGAI